jgi:lipoate-protein ligase A
MNQGAWCDLGSITPQASVRADAALLRHRELGGIPDSLLFYSRDRPAISLGHFSSEDELDLDLVAARGVEIVRRVSGGRPIYSDMGQINYALAIGADHLPEGPGQVFALVCRGLISSLGEFGVVATHHAPNDIEVNGRKISGSALKRGRGAMLVHGTLLVATDLELMGGLFRPRVGRAPRTRQELTDLRSEMKSVPARTDLTTALAGGLGQALGLEFRRDRSFLQIEQR